MLISNPERFVIIPNIDEGAKFVIAHEAKENISPKETSAITSNGKHVISPSSGFNAMREVEVDVNVDLKGSLQDKQVTITENGTQTIVADEGFEGLNSVEVNCSIYEELNFDNLGYDVNDKAQIFGVINNKFTFAKSRYLAWNKNNTSGAQFFDSAKFGNAATMEFAPKIDTSNLITADYMYRGTPRLEYFPPIDVSKITSAISMFQNSGIKKLPNLVFQSLKNATSMFQGSSLTDISNLYFPNLTSANNMFHTTAITYISSSFVNLSRAKSLSQLCNGCTRLTEVGLLDTSSATVFDYIFGNCHSLHTVALLDCTNAISMSNAFNTCSKLINLGGFKNLKVSLNLSASTILTHESLMNVINNLYDLTANGLSEQALTIGSTNLAKLTADEIAIGTNKGWTIK
jgi:hypothetical protein